MLEPKTIYAKIACDAIVRYLKTGEKVLEDESVIPAALKLRLPCFVSVSLNGIQVGKSGSFEPQHDSLYHEIVENAISAAGIELQKKTVREEDLKNMTFTVEVLSRPRTLTPRSDLEPGKHGVYLEKVTERKTTAAPDLHRMISREELLSKVRELAEVEDGVRAENIGIRYYAVIRYH
jgi:AMMECR1 domain-containing protein